MESVLRHMGLSGAPLVWKLVQNRNVAKQTLTRWADAHNKNTHLLAIRVGIQMALHVGTDTAVIVAVSVRKEMVQEVLTQTI